MDINEKSINFINQLKAEAKTTEHSESDNIIGTSAKFISAN